MTRWLLALALSLVISAASAQTSEPYDFKGVRLGITLTEFRALPAPDGVGEEGQEVVVACGGDQPDSMGASCRWAVPRTLSARGAYDTYQSSVVESLARTEHFPPAAIWIGLDRGSASFAFTRDTDGELRLSEISVGATSAMAPVVEAGLVERFGRPRQRERGNLITGLGIAVAQDQLTWRNAVSSIHVRSPDGSLNLMSVTYRHTRLGDLSDARYQPRNPM